METENLSRKVADYVLDLDGFMSWEEFYGSSNENLVESILEMYDFLIGRSSEIKEDFINTQTGVDFQKSPYLAENLNAKDLKAEGLGKWCTTIEKDEECKCTEKSEPEITSQNLKESDVSGVRNLRVLKPDVNFNCRSEPALAIFQSKCDLKTCPAGFSTPATPVQNRLKKLETQSPLSYKRNESYFQCFTRRSSISSLASSSSSSSGASSCYGSRRHGDPRKSQFLASVESFEDDSDIERVRKDDSCRFSKELEGSEDSGLHIPCTSLPMVRSKYCDPHLSYMDKVVTEIIETEEVYVSDLRQIIEGYFLKWKNLPDFPFADSLDTLFGNVEAVFNFNSLFLKDLKQCGLDPVKVAQCFVRNNGGFSVYTEYCTNYPKTVTLLTELMRQEGYIRLFRERQAVLQHTLPLGSYLLKPVQRILKYHLLLRNIVKQYSNGIEGYKDIVDALRTMTEIAQHINDMKRRHEHKVRVQEIQSLLLGWEREDLTTFGELCAEGTFRMYGAKALRHVFLFDKMLLITKKKEGEFLDYKAHINCSNLMLIESVPGEPLSFHVIPFDNPKLQYTLQCRNLEQKREWTLQLKRVILENYNAVIPSHARQLVMELGQNKIEDESSPNKLLLKKHHLAPEYLERRKQERRKNEFNNKYRMRRHKDLESGQKEEDQPKKLETPSQSKTNSTEDELSTKEKNSEDLSSKSKSTEKLEIKTLEYIVTQILKQNRDFEKILKRQRQIISKSRNLSSRRRKKREGNFNEGKNVCDTIKSLKFLRSPQPQAPVETENNSDSDYVTLLGGSQDCESCGSENAKSNSRVTPSNESRSPQLLSAPSDDGIPTSPSVWLKRQVHHLPNPPKKAGSLPRSFHISSESSSANSRFFRDIRVSIERPFTIASDKITSTMFFEGMERFCRNQFGRSKSNNASEEIDSTDGLNTPGASLDQLNIHPEYKIYRQSLSGGALKNVFSSVQNKLSHMKLDIVQKLEFEKKMASKERKASKVIYMFAKNYQKALRNKQKGKNCDNETKSFMHLDLPETKTPIHKQGSESLGERLAHFTDSDCRIHPIRTSKKAAALLGIQSNYVLSLNSTLSTYDDSSPKTNEILTKDDDTDESVDFYERRFDKMTEELSQDTAILDEDLDALNYKLLIRKPSLEVPSKVKTELFIETVQEAGEDSPVFNLMVSKEEIDDT